MARMGKFSSKRSRISSTCWAAALAEALDEHLLGGVVEVVAQRRAGPACRQVGADDAGVAAGQLLAVGRAAGRRARAPLAAHLPMGMATTAEARPAACLHRIPHKAIRHELAVARHLRL